MQHLRTTLNLAVKEQLIESNPARYITVASYCNPRPRSGPKTAVLRLGTDRRAPVGARRMTRTACVLPRERYAAAPRRRHVAAAQARRRQRPWIGLHGLHHSYATLLLEAGVQPKIVQERRGHSSTTVTMDIYSHVIPLLQGEAADLGAALVDADEPLEADQAEDLDDDQSIDEPKEGEAA